MNNFLRRFFVPLIWSFLAAGLIYLSLNNIKESLFIFMILSGVILVITIINSFLTFRNIRKDIFRNKIEEKTNIEEEKEYSKQNSHKDRTYENRKSANNRKKNNFREFKGNSHSRFDTNNLSFGCSIFISIIAIIWLIPAITIYWILNPDDYKKGIKVSVLFVSMSFAIVYYLFKSESFPKSSDKLTFFTSVILGPVGFIEIFL